MPGLALPPFPDDVPTHPLLVVDYALVQAGDEQETDKLWKAATELGFWYLKNHGADQLVDVMFNMGKETMDLPLEEKMQFEQGDSGTSFGYKAAGANATDEYGNIDTVEFINVSKDDAIAYPETVHRTYPRTVNVRMEGTIKPFVKKSLEVNTTVLSVFEKKLDLRAGALLECHPLAEPSGSEARVIKNPPPRANEHTSANPKVALGAHTDFGSLSFLHNRLGGLQVLPPGSTEWSYVRPLPGHAVCNVGDALTILSGGMLRSNLHRVVPPPGAQAASGPRWSLVFFTRPGNSVKLEALQEDSALVKEKLDKMSADDRKKYEPGVTAAEWFARRIRNQRMKNRTGPETWRASRGMEHKPEAI